MKILVIVLLIISSLIFIGSLIAIYMNHSKDPKEEAAEIKTDKHTEISNQLKKTIDEIERHEVNLPDSTYLNQDLMRSLTVKWKEFPIAFNNCSLNGGLLLYFKGKTKTKETVLYSFQHSSAFEVFLDSVRDIWDENLMPVNDFYISLPFREVDVHIFSKETEIYLKDHQVKVSYVLMESDSIYHFSKMDYTAAFIGVGSLSSVTYQIPENSEKWIKKLSYLYEPIYADRFNDIMKAADEFIPKKIAMQVSMPFSRKKGIQALINTYPEVNRLFVPYVRVNENELTLYAENAEILKQADTLLLESAKENSISMKQILYSDVHREVSVQSESYLHLYTAVTNVFSYDCIIPKKIETSENTCSYEQYDVLSFTPDLKELNTNRSKIKSFYIQFMLK